MSDYTFTQTEHLKSRKAIDKLLDTKDGFLAYPFRVTYRIVASDALAHPVQVMFIVRKKRFRHATDRNRFKRLLREAYRRHKQPLLEYATAHGLCLHIAFIGISNTLPSFANVQDKMCDAIDCLCKL